MAASVNQDFVTFVGDAVSPVFLVLNASGSPVDISGVNDITWNARRNLDDAVVLTKSKSGGGITFVTTGTDGKFQVALTAADTAALSGWYMHTATIVPTAGNPVTTTVGRMNVGQSPSWTWDPGQVGIEALYTVRSIIGDVVQSDQLVTDQQVKWAIGEYSNEWLAGAELARNIAMNFARQVDIGEGPMKKNYSQRSKQYFALSRDLEQRGFARGGVQAYVGGVSVADKTTVVSNPDRVPPNFLIAMHDNLLPEGPVGLQTNANLAATQNIGTVTTQVP